MGGKELKMENSEPRLNPQRRHMQVLSSDLLQGFFFPSVTRTDFEVVSQNLKVYFSFVDF